jgi:flagellar protein FliO/FliZ
MLEGMVTAIGMIVIMGGILYLAYISSRSVGKLSLGKRCGQYMKVVDQISLGTDRMIAIVETSGTYLLVGIGSSQITILDKMDEITMLECTHTEAPKVEDFRLLFEKWKERKK